VYSSLARPPAFPAGCGPRYALFVKKNERAAFRRDLLNWFRRFQRDLPWRRTHDPYRIWLSEIMLQQTRVAAAIPYYERFLDRFPSIRALAGAPQEEVLRLWSGLGYYSRARNLQKAAQQIVAKQNGEFPRTKEAVLALPGIGEYTAAAILSIAFGQDHAVLDGNVARVLARLDAIRGNLHGSKRWRALQQTADALLDPSSPGEWNQAMMELGATVCTPRSPQCLICPLANVCKARRLGVAELLPEKRKKRQPVEVTIVAAVFLNARGETLLLPPPVVASKNTADDVPTLVSKMWHFPSRSAEKHPARALKKLLSEFNAGSLCASGRFVPLTRVRHAVTYRKIQVLPFRFRVRSLPRISGARLVPLAEVSSLPVSNLTRKIARAAMA
jgi:A/G-specific adenine glycosylase